MNAVDDLGLHETHLRAQRALALYLNPPPTPDPFEPMPRRAIGTREHSITLTRCKNPYCREWPIEGTLEAGECLYCGEPIGER